MRVSEILRQLADLVDQEEGTDQMPVQMPDQTAQPDEMCADVAVTQMEPVEIALDGTEDEPMVSPLQQQHELMKKATGVDNHVDTFAGEDGGEDELELMKKMAGIGEEQEGPHDHAADCQQVSINPRANAALEANGKQDHRLMQTKHRDQK